MIKAASAYAQELSNYGHGFPLWTPEPEDGHGIRIGDVGYIDEDGQFHRLFNVTVGADHPLNAHGVPEDFTPLSFPSRLVHIKENQILSGPITSKSVRKRESQASAGVDIAGTAGSSSLSYTFDCSREQGAILVLGDAAKKVSVPHAARFESYMRSHHKEWYAFATNPETYGLVCDPEDIVLVRGTVKTRSWALAAYSENSNQTSISFGGKLGPFADAAFHWSTAKSVSGQFEYRVGSSAIGRGSRLRTALTQDGHSSQPYELELPEVLAEQGRSAESTADPDAPVNQGVFLQRFKIKYRFWTLQKKITAAAGHDSLQNNGEDPSISPAVLSDDESDTDADELQIDVDPTFTQSQPHTPVDDILDYILKFSKAQVAIASDQDIADLIQMEEPTDDFAQYLLERRPRILVDEDGTGIISVLVATAVPDSCGSDSFSARTSEDQYGTSSNTELLPETGEEQLRPLSAALQLSELTYHHAFPSLNEEVPNIIPSVGPHTVSRIVPPALCLPSITFHGLNKHGLPLEKAFAGDLNDMSDGDEHPVLQVEACPTISCRIKWPGYPSISSTFNPTNRSTAPENPASQITKAELARLIAEAVRRFMQENANVTADGTAEEWKLEKINFKDLNLLELRHVSEGTWQPVLLHVPTGGKLRSTAAMHDTLSLPNTDELAVVQSSPVQDASLDPDRPH